MKLFTLICSLAIILSVNAQPKDAKGLKANSASPKDEKELKIIPAAHRTQVYLPLLKGKRVGIFANHTATIGDRHLVDTLYTLGVKITKAFGPEHGFRGTADAGEKIDNYVDPYTGIPVVSLYGKKRKPSAEDLADVDVLLFDIQDVGTRFYTYISSLQEFMDAAFEHGKPLMILDRPNPNGFYVDGPILDTAYKSFVGMQPIPIVYGMTMGEYALMLAGEKWLSPKANERYEYYRRAKNSPPDTLFHFQVIKNQNYTHKSQYELPAKPSPNLPDMSSIYWYASTCFFEGTVLSEGRGTDHPFSIFGHPYLPKNMYAFTPTSRDGAKEPKLKDRQSYGWNLFGTKDEVLKKVDNKIQLKYLLEAYKLFPDKDNFFIKPKSEKPTDYFFNKLAGSDQLMNQIKAGKTEKEIRDSWAPGIAAFKKIRKQYLLYLDFE
ncbi:DUF1343 domain-containing protein [Sediminibacterium sp.]|uniref:exo-beta-N-acetylmuramidase NamZ family protein n=1 Tax=Sediminibacterium sp. TaxID=1917865 RepID=UPI0025D9AC2E|nr:DUF1343 domain-containing protein [Sediminibacterium sp.]MBW0176492.1 DUF1343 domain-containing protein [Sediminibacterium sp.]